MCKFLGQSQSLHTFHLLGPMRDDTYTGHFTSCANSWAVNSQYPWDQSEQGALFANVAISSCLQNCSPDFVLTIPPSRLDAPGKPRLLNMAAVTSGKIPPRRFRPENKSVSYKHGDVFDVFLSIFESSFFYFFLTKTTTKDLQHDCAAMAELAYLWYVSAR